MRPLTASLHAACRTMSRLAACLGILLLLGACDDNAPPPAPEIRPVRVVTVAPRSGGDSVSITGTVAAETEVNLAFRIDGRMVERLVNVGDRVDRRPGRRPAGPAERGEFAARRPRPACRHAGAVDRGAQQLPSGSANCCRPASPRASATTRRRKPCDSAKSALDAAQAQANIAENRLGYTELHADAGGTVTARGAEPGEVVQPGRMIVQIAREEGRDAVFDVPPSMKDQAPADPVIEVALTMDPAVRADRPGAGSLAARRSGDRHLPRPRRAGRPAAGDAARLHRHRADGVGGGAAIEVPASALTRAQQQPAVWVVDPATQTVALRPVEVLRFDPARVLIAQGLETGEIVVTAGVQALRPGQKVRLLGARARPMIGPNLSAIAVSRRSVTVYFMILAVLAGTLTFLRLGRNEDPAFTFRTMVVQAGWPGASIEEMLLQVTERLERTLQEAPNLDTLRSYTVPAQTTIFVDLKGSTPAGRGAGHVVPGAQAHRRHAPHAAAGRRRPRLQRRFRRHLRHHLRLHRRRLHATASCATRSSRCAPACCRCPTSRRSRSWARRTR